MSTPKRSTRSNSTTGISLSDIKQLIDTSKNEIISFVNEKFDSLNTTLSLLTDRVQKIEDKLTAVDDVGKRNKEEIEELKDGMDFIRELLPVQILREVEERNFKRPNLVLSGISELSSGSVDERKSHDETVVNNISNDLNINISGHFRCFRIGKPGSERPRLLKVVFTSMEDKMNLLRKGKMLRKSERFRQVYINPDLTILQRENNRSLREELKRRREAGEQVMIRGDKVVELREQNFL